jgi:RNA polymerase sigma factor (TIGR02999 family)
MSGDVTRWLSRLREGDPGALDRLVPLLYDELRALARRLLAGERPGQTLTPTALVHETYLRLSRERRIGADDRGEFFAVAAVAMRRILVESARRKRRLKRGGEEVRVELEAVDALVSETEVDELLAIDAALDRLGDASRRARQVVELRIFAGLTVEEVAGVLAVHEKTVRRDWLTARAWLRRELAAGGAADGA